MTLHPKTSERLIAVLFMTTLMLAAVVGVMLRNAPENPRLAPSTHQSPTVMRGKTPPPPKSSTPSKTDINVAGTVYNAVPSQTDDSPFVTADGTDLRGLDLAKVRYCALSRDLLARWGGPICYGQVVHVEGAGDLDGDWEVHDTMNKRFTNHIDFLVPESRKTGRWSTLVLTY